jgi:hypothetical protein
MCCADSQIQLAFCKNSSIAKVPKCRFYITKRARVHIALSNNEQSRREGNELGVFSFRTCVFLTLRDELPTEMSRALGPPHPNGFVSNPSIVCPARRNLLRKRKQPITCFRLPCLFLNMLFQRRAAAPKVWSSNFDPVSFSGQPSAGFLESSELACQAHSQPLSPYRNYTKHRGETPFYHVRAVGREGAGN